MGRRLLVSPFNSCVSFLMCGMDSVIIGILMQSIVDGAAWRTQGSSPGNGFKYPDFLLADEVVKGVKGGKKSKL